MEGNQDVVAAGSPELSIASSLIPWDRDDERAMFFGARACGLSVREALHYIKRSKAWLSGCRHDEKFVELESKIPDFRRDLAKEYVELHTYRNYFMVLERDKQVLEKATRNNRDDPLTRQEHEYLIKLRTMYTPAQLDIIENLVKGGTDGFNFSKFIMEHPDIIQMSRTDTITVAKGNQDG